MKVLQSTLLFLLSCSSVIVRETNGFVMPVRGVGTRVRNEASTILSLKPEESFVLSDDEIGPTLDLKVGSKGNVKIVNSYGLLGIFVSLLTCPIWSLAMYLVNAVVKDDPSKELYDYTGKIWSRAWMSLMNSFPAIEGLENIDLAKEQSKDGLGVLYVANHASWLDIPTICCAIDPVFKFIAKGQLTSTPFIGQQLKGGDHVLIDREDRRSQLRTFKECINWLKSGVSIMAFPEGMRSPDGRLIEFKGGSFSMASKTGSIIVPITMTNTHAVMPMNAIFPVQSGAGKLEVIIHPPINPEGKTEDELTTLVRNSIISRLPPDQVPLSTAYDKEIDSIASLSKEKAVIAG